jgi:predicted nucleic acid-binding protein
MSEKPNIILDTNLWVYLYANNANTQVIRVKYLIDKHFQTIIVSTQILGELYYVLTRKGFQSKELAKEIILKTVATFPVVGIGAINVVKALEVQERYNYSYWDSLLIATALLNEVTVLYSEDMQHNQFVANKTRIINPFF